jgi:hypothetical protein
LIYIHEHFDGWGCISKEEIKVKGRYLLLPILCIVLGAMVSGCSDGNGTLADYFGWQSLGGTWRGTMDLSGESTMPVAMTFTEFDGDSFHVVVEAGEGDKYIRNDGDAVYTMETKSFTFQIVPFLGGPCTFQGRVVDRDNITGNFFVELGLTMLTGVYDITYAK